MFIVSDWEHKQYEMKKGERFILLSIATEYQIGILISAPTSHTHSRYNFVVNDFLISKLSILL